MLSQAPREQRLQALMVSVAQASAAVSRFCDRAEHLEITDVSAIREAGATLRSAAVELARGQGVDIIGAYLVRLQIVEARRAVVADEWAAPETLAGPVTWEVLQQIQAKHDAVYHADVTGMSKAEQIRHYSFHLAKLVGALASEIGRASLSQEFRQTRLPDLLLFGVKLSTLVDERLSSHEIEGGT